MRTHFRAFANSRVVIFHQNFKRSLKDTSCDKSANVFFMVGLLHNTIYHEMHALILVFNLIDTSLSLFHRFTTTFLSKWENETFSVKCSLNADHFISLISMWTKSAIADFYGSTAYLKNCIAINKYQLEKPLEL